MKYKFRLDRLDTSEYVIEAPDRMEAELSLHRKAEVEPEKLFTEGNKVGYVITYLGEAGPDAG